MTKTDGTENLMRSVVNINSLNYTLQKALKECGRTFPSFSETYSIRIQAHLN